MQCLIPVSYPPDHQSRRDLAHEQGETQNTSDHDDRDLNVSSGVRTNESDISTLSTISVFQARSNPIGEEAYSDSEKYMNNNDKKTVSFHIVRNSSVFML